MSVKRKFSIAIVDSEKISEINQIVTDYASITMQSSSHILFFISPINQDDIKRDITFFEIESEDNYGLDKKLNELIEDLNKLDTTYSLRDEDEGKMIVSVKIVGAFDIKFDNVKFIKEGTYEKIDKIKNLKTEFGICKGYKPNYRALESQSVENIDIKPESIYLFCDTEENLSKLKELLTEKVKEIDSDLEVGYRSLYTFNH